MKILQNRTVFVISTLLLKGASFKQGWEPMH